MGEPGRRTSRRERLIKKIGSTFVRLLYRNVEVYEAPAQTARGPILGVANHFGGFADPLILVYALDRVPRFIARDVIWRYPVSKQILNFVRAIPVHKRQDEGPKGNDQMFRSSYEALGSDELVVIFPEGITVDDPSIAPIPTGAARIALGARANGVEGIQIVPAGIHYEDKASLRSKVFVNVGEGIDLDAEIDRYADGGLADGSDRAAVRALTDDIEDRLRRSAPDFKDWREARALRQAAEISCRTAVGGTSVVDHGDRARLAGMLSRSSQPARDAVIGAVGDYQRDLDALGVSDAQMLFGLSSPGALARYFARSLLIGVILLPFALIGALINLIPMALMWLVGRMKAAPAMMATVKPVAAVVVFGITWGLWCWFGWSSGGLRGLAMVLLLLPAYLFALVALIERVHLVARAWVGWRRSRRAESVFDTLMDRRRSVVETVVGAL